MGNEGGFGGRWKVGLVETKTGVGMDMGQIRTSRWFSLVFCMVAFPSLFAGHTRTLC